MKAIKAIISVVLIICPAIYFGISENNFAMGMAVVAGAMASVFLNLDKFESFKGAGFEAKLKKAIEEAEVTIARLQKIYKPLLIMSVHQLTYMKRFAGFGIDNTKLVESFVDIARELEIDDDEDFVKEASSYFRWYIWDTYSGFVRVIQNDINSDGKLTDHKRVNAICDKFYSLRKQGTVEFPTKEKIMEVANDCGVDLNQDAKESLNNYLSCANEYSKRIEFEEEYYIALD